MKKPITERISMTWNTSSSAVATRPATDITRKQVIDPAIQKLALRFEGSGAMGRYVANRSPPPQPLAPIFRMGQRCGGERPFAANLQRWRLAGDIHLFVIPGRSRPKALA